MLAYQLLREEEQGLSVTGVDVKSTSCPVNVENDLEEVKDAHRTFCKAIIMKSE
jgi:hypothetical protein